MLMVPSLNLVNKKNNNKQNKQTYTANDNILETGQSFPKILV